MATVYVQELFGLLRYLNIEQQAVVTAVRSNKTQVSLWANGKRPLPKRAMPAFFAFMAQTITAGTAAAWATPSPPREPPTLLRSPAPAEQWEQDLLLCLHRWELECVTTGGQLSKDHEGYRATLRPYFYVDLLKLSDDEFTIYMTAFRGAYRTGRLLAHLRHRTDLTEGRVLSPPLRTDISPLDYFWRLASTYQADADEDEENGRV
jgi:hypothetical protein